MKQIPPLLLTVREVMDILRIHRTKVYELIEDGTLKGCKVGGNWRVRRDSLEALIGPIPTDYHPAENQDDKLDAA